MNHLYIDRVDDKTREATMRLYGTIGEKIDGDMFAQELASLDGLDLVRIRINSPGGDVYQGMSIVSAVLAMKTPVHMYVDGVAASMAGVIAVCGDSVIMMDFSQFMMHDPKFRSDIELTAKDKKALAHMKDMLQRVLARRGKSEEEVASLMTAETWLTASEAKEHGLCDEIVSSAKAKVKAMAGLTPMQIIAQIDAENQTKIDSMKFTNEASALLNVAADAPEAEVSAAIVALGKRATDAEARAKTAEDKLTDLENKAAKDREAEAKTLIDAATKDGRINASDKTAIPAWEGMFAANHEGAKAALAAIPVRESVANKVGTKNDADKKLLDMEWAAIDKAGRLGELKEKFPEAYAEKFEARFGTKPANK